MKKYLRALPLASLCVCAAHAQSSVALYGLLDTGVTYTNRVQLGNATEPASRWAMHPGAMQASRLGYRGSEDLGGGTRAVFTIESGINVDNGTLAQGGLAFGRKAVVGLDGAFGSLLLGRQTDFLDDMGSLSSTIDFGSQASLIHGLDRTYAERTNNSVRYNSPRAAGLMGSAMLGFGENAGSTSAGQTLSLGLDYVRQDLRLAAGYYQTRLAGGTAGASGTSADAGAANIGAQPGALNVTGAAGDVALRTFSFGGAYQWGAARLHGTYSDSRQPLAAAGGARTLRGSSSRKATVLDIGLSYALTPALNLNASVIHDRVAFVGAPSGRLTQYNLGMDYFLSKRTDLYANSGYQTASAMVSPGMGEGAPGLDRSQLLLRVGIRHKF